MVELSNKTLPQVFLKQVQDRRRETALREKDFGIWS